MLIVFLIASLLQSPELASFSFTATWRLNYFDGNHNDGDGDAKDVDELSEYSSQTEIHLGVAGFSGHSGYS